MRYSTIAVTAGLAAGALAQRDVPSNLKDLYNQAKGNGCNKFLQQGFYDEEDGSKDFGYCGDHLSDDGIIYITGSKGKLANMDIDCDGQQNGPGNDGRCGSSTDTQSQTTWEDEAAKLSGGKIKDLNAYVHTYVVFGNDDTKPAFDPRQYGMEPLALMAVVCGDKLVYGVWGDTNGNDGPPLVGEAAISTATLCFGDSVNGNSGHDQEDVLFIGFTGKNAVPQDANWGAQSAKDFESSLSKLGDSLVAKIGGGSGSGNSTDGGNSTSSSSPAPTSTSDGSGSATSDATQPTGTSGSDGGDGGDDGNDGGDDGSDGGDNGDDGDDDSCDANDDGDDGDDGSDCGDDNSDDQ